LLIFVGRLKCSCCLFEYNGYPCRHMASVLADSVDGWTGFELNDISVCWWNLYSSMDYSCPYIEDVFNLMENDISGPKYQGNMSSAPLDYVEDVVSKCRNYSDEQITSALADFNLFGCAISGHKGCR
jgi:hypothetical protein